MMRAVTKNYPAPEILGVNLRFRHPGFCSASQAQHISGQEETVAKRLRDDVVARAFQTRGAALARAYPGSRTWLA